MSRKYSGNIRREQDNVFKLLAPIQLDTFTITIDGVTRVSSIRSRCVTEKSGHFPEEVRTSEIYSSMYLTLYFILVLNRKYCFSDETPIFIFPIQQGNIRRHPPLFWQTSDENSFPNITDLGAVFWSRVGGLKGSVGNHGTPPAEGGGGTPEGLLP